MTFRKFFAAMTAAGIGLSLPAAAEGFFNIESAESSFYVSGFIGGGFPSDADFSGVQAPEAGVPGAAGAPANIDADFDEDVFYGAAIGYQLPVSYWTYFHPRVEFEISRLESDVDDGSFNGGNQTFGGDLETTFFLINSYSDIRWTDDQLIVPYVGGGIGLADVDANIEYAGGGAPAPNFAVRGDETGFVSTLAAGVTIDTPGAFELYGEGRYYRVYDVEFDRRFIANGANGFSAEVDDDLDGFTLTAGVRARF